MSAGAMLLGKLRGAVDAAALADLVAREVAVALVEAIAARGEASLVLSGGSTPRAVFERLAGAGGAGTGTGSGADSGTASADDATTTAIAAVDWSRVIVTLADERAVPPDDSASNERFLREHLLRGAVAAVRFVPLHREDGDLDAVTAALGAMRRPFDMVLLGMGTDGHTASLFPDAPELEAALRHDAPVLMAMHPPSAAQARITLTRRALLDSRVRLLHITGDDKRPVLEAALGAWDEGGDVAATPPVARVLCADPARAGIRWST